MKDNSNFAKKFLSICLGITLVTSSMALLMFSIQPSRAETPATDIEFPGAIQTGTNENYIPVGVHNGYAYWIIFNTTDGYKFRKSPLDGSHWGSRTE